MRQKNSLNDCGPETRKPPSHAVDAFLGALGRTLAAEVQKLGHRTMEEAVAAARRIEKILEEQTDTKMEHLVSTVQDQIRILKKDLKEANEQIAAIRPQQLLPTPWPLFPHLPSQPLNCLLPLPLPLTTSTRSRVKILSSTALPDDRWIDDRHAASSAERKDTSSPIVQPVQFSSTFSASKHSPAPSDHLEDKYWSSRNSRTTPKLTPTCS